MPETMTDEELAVFMVDGLSLYDLAHMTAIIKSDHGNWYHAKLLRAFDVLLRVADDQNLERLRFAYPGTVAAYTRWYNGHLRRFEEQEIDRKGWCARDCGKVSRLTSLFCSDECKAAAQAERPG